MTGSSRPNPPIEERLDQLLDGLSPGSGGNTDDPQLADFALLATAIRDDDEVEWPDDAYPSQLSDELYAELATSTRATPNGYVPDAQWDDEGHPEGQPVSSTPPATATRELIGEHPGWPRPRRILGVAAAIAGFALVTLVLVAVFGGLEDENTPAVGGTEEDRPPQFAVTMQTDPVNGNADIFLVSLDGSEPVNLTDNPANDTFPAWSPDGSNIAFISDRSGEDAIYIMEADGSYVYQLDPFRNHPSSNPEVEWHYRNLAWSPDGSTIAAMRYPIDSETEGPQVLIIDAGGAGLRVGGIDPAYPELTFDQKPVWAPDSQWLMFEIRNEDESRLAVNGRGAGYRTPPYLLPNSSTGMGPNWSVNGEIALANDDGISIVEFTGELSDLVSDEINRISVPESGSVSSVEWSPDGSQLALNSQVTGSSGIWITDVSGENLTEIPDSNFAVYPVWSPDGARLAFLRAGMVFSADATGYELMIYDLASASIAHRIDTGFSGPLMNPPAWRPAGPETDDDNAVQPTPTDPPTTPPSVATATAIANYEFSPPHANLRVLSNVIPGYVGSYRWQFSDVDRTLTYIDAPIIPLPNEPGEIESGVPLELEIYGDEFNRPPLEVVFELYAVERNLVTPDDDSGPDEPAFSIQTAPLLVTQASDPASPETSYLLADGHYIVVARASWGTSPVDGEELFVTWIFDVVVDEAEDPSSFGSETQQAVAQVRDFLDDPRAELAVDQVTEDNGRIFVNLSRPLPGQEEQAQGADQFFVDVSDGTLFGADLNSNSTLAQPYNPVDAETARAIAEAFFEGKNEIPGEFAPFSAEILTFTDEVLNVSWGIESDGMWLPTTVQVGVDLQTGLVVRYVARDFPYNGPRQAQIPAQDARQTAEEIIASDPALAGATIESVRLTATFSNFFEDIVDGRVVRNLEAEWRLAWEFVLVDQANPRADQMIWIDAVFGERLTTGA